MPRKRAPKTESRRDYYLRQVKEGKLTRAQAKKFLRQFPASRGDVVNVVHPRGGFKHTRAIVMGVVKPDSFSRAYGRQVFVCDARSGSVSEVGAGDAIPVGRTKRIPASCKVALAEYKKTYSGR